MKREHVIELLKTSDHPDVGWFVEQVENKTRGGNMICCVVATTAHALHDPEYRKCLVEGSIESTIELVPGLPDWVKAHPEEFDRPMPWRSASENHRVISDVTEVKPLLEEAFGVKAQKGLSTSNTAMLRSDIDAMRGEIRLLKAQNKRISDDLQFQGEMTKALLPYQDEVVRLRKWVQERGHSLTCTRGMFPGSEAAKHCSCGFDELMAAQHNPLEEVQPSVLTLDEIISANQMTEIVDDTWYKWVKNDQAAVQERLMPSRVAEVTWNRDEEKPGEDTFTVSGILYKAGVPNTNNVVYTKGALEEAVKRAKGNSFIPVTVYKCVVDPKIRDVIGELKEIDIDDNGVVRVTVETMPHALFNPPIYHGLLASASGPTRSVELALAGACVAYGNPSESKDEVNVIESGMTITSVAICYLRDVQQSHGDEPLEE